MRNLTRTGSKINSLIGKALNGYNMISDGDKVLLAVSGGKDSLTMTDLIRKIQGWAPVKFDLIAAHITSDIHCGDDKTGERIFKFVKELGIEYRSKHIEIIEKMDEANCFWCSWNRRKALFELAEELGCNKVALGHHKDDIVETMLMNLLYNGEISAMNPFQEMFKGKLTIIRPLCYVEEKLIKAFSKEMEYEAISCACPFGNNTRRQYIKNFLKDAEKNTPKINIKSNIFKSVSRIKKEYIDLRGEVSKE